MFLKSVKTLPKDVDHRRVISLNCALEIYGSIEYHKPGRLTSQLIRIYALYVISLKAQFIIFSLNSISRIGSSKSISISSNISSISLIILVLVAKFSRNLQLAKLNNIESSELIATTNKDQANLPSLPEIAENNVHDLEQNANGSEVLQEKPKKGKGRPRKVPGALENSPKSPVNSSTQILRRSTRNK